MMGGVRAILLAVAATSATAQAPEPDTYRMENYRAPVPDSLDGGHVVDTAEAFDLWQGGEVAFIDVMPRPPKPPNLPEGTIWRDKPRYSIRGAMWLPNVGYGAIADVTDDWFRTGLQQATGADMNHPVLFFCLDDCWMSWNAAKRALSYGYSTVYWYPEGTDGWTFFDHPTEVVAPVPGEPGAQ